MSFIFISYSRQDQDYVNSLAQELQSHNLPVWIDDRIDYGTTWPRVIREQLERCQLVLVVMSPRSEESYWVRCELIHALEIRKPIFPLLLEGPRWFSVAALQTVDVTGGKLPPVRFFDTLRTHFPAPIPTAEPLQNWDHQLTRMRHQFDQVVKIIPELASEMTWLESRLRLGHEEQAPHIVPAQQPAPAQPAQEDDLSSEKGVDYSKLRDLLKAGQWQEADRETARCMLEAVGRKENDYIRKEELLNFPCADLRTIDVLWVKYSHGKWGFSVQKRIYVECGATLDGNYPGDKIWYEFCRRVGWRKGNDYVSYSKLTLDLSNSPEGEFPAWGVGRGWGRGWGGGRAGWSSSLAQRLVNCSK